MKPVITEEARNAVLQPIIYSYVARIRSESVKYLAPAPEDESNYWRRLSATDPNSMANKEILTNIWKLQDDYNIFQKIIDEVFTNE